MTIEQCANNDSLEKWTNAMLLIADEQGIDMDGFVAHSQAQQGHTRTLSEMIARHVRMKGQAAKGSFVQFAFDWSESPEGFNYWRRFHDVVSKLPANYNETFNF